MKAIITLGYHCIAVTGLDAKALEAITKAHVVDYDYGSSNYHIEDNKRVEIKLVDDKSVTPKPVKQAEVL